MFIDDSGNLTLLLSDASKASNAQAALATALGADRFAGAPIHVLEAQFGFLDLYAWRLEMRSGVLGLPGVVSLDIDERSNRLRVGVEDMKVAGDVEAALAQLRVPKDAVIIEAVEPVTPLVTLQDNVRPVKGGLQIQRQGNYTCTLGFNAVKAGVNGFVTNSHCTSIQGGVESTVFYQPTLTPSSNRIGVEWNDGPYWTGSPCPPGRRCRWSDSAFVKYDTGVSFTRGIIARTNLSSTTIIGDYRISAEVTLPAVGETLNKVGRSSGRTQGNVTNTCADADDGTFVFLCQNRVAAAAQAGDSGGPVFKITNNPAANDVSLYGLVWAGDGTGSWFSSLQTIQYAGEIGGPLYTCASVFGC